MILTIFWGFTKCEACWVDEVTGNLFIRFWHLQYTYNYHGHSRDEESAGQRGYLPSKNWAGIWTPVVVVSSPQLKPQCPDDATETPGSASLAVDFVKCCSSKLQSSEQLWGRANLANAGRALYLVWKGRSERREGLYFEQERKQDDKRNKPRIPHESNHRAHLRQAFHLSTPFWQPAH